MKEKLELLKRIQKLDHECFMLNCKAIEYYLEGKKADEIEKEIAEKEMELEKLRKEYRE